MKILYVDNSIKGHHVPYLFSLRENANQSIYVLPDYLDGLRKEEQYICQFDYKNIFSYVKWICYVKKIAQTNKVDIIHFLYGDIFYRFFGIALSFLKNYRVIITFHHIRQGLLRDISLRKIFKRIEKGVVHTESLLKCVKNKNIRNVYKIEYPVFEKISMLKKEEACEMLGLDSQVKTFLCFGGTRYDKGIDIFLDALTKVEGLIQIIIAGKAEFFSEQYIISRLEAFKGKYCVQLRYIEKEEMGVFFSASDVVVLPYRMIFDGASGPLGIGCVCGKKIIGPSHGSIGQIVNDNHLGCVFESENVESLVCAIQESISEDFVYDSAALKYKSKLMPDIFVSEYNNIYNT